MATATPTDTSATHITDQGAPTTAALEPAPVRSSAATATKIKASTRAGGQKKPSSPPALPRSPQRSLLMPATFLFLVSAPAVFSLSVASQALSPWILLVYLFLVWALGITLAFLGRRGPRTNSKSGRSRRV